MLVANAGRRQVQTLEWPAGVPAKRHTVAIASADLQLHVNVRGAVVAECAGRADRAQRLAAGNLFAPTERTIELHVAHHHAQAIAAEYRHAAVASARLECP